MLGSITPLGERSRGSRWGATVIMYIAGSLLGGVIVGTAAGLAGAWLAPSHRSALAALGALLAIGALVDTGRSPVTLPTPRRQANEDWLRRYRSWVYGGGWPPSSARPPSIRRSAPRSSPARRRPVRPSGRRSAWPGP